MNRLLPSFLFCLPLLVGCGTAQKSATNPCEGVVCINGFCVDDLGVAACVCSDGYTKQSGACLKPPMQPEPNACDANPCASTGRAKCSAVNGVAVCTCLDSQVEVGGACVTKTACTPSPCTLPHQTRCEVTNGAARCLCAEGYAPAGAGCSATPVFDCEAQHSGSAAEDEFEPDECPSQANALTLGTPQMRSLAPTGDVDWVSVFGEKNHILKLTLSGAVALYVDLYDSTGLIALAADHRGNPTAEVQFSAPASGTYFVRVKALRTSDTGAYTLTATDLGADDYTGVLDEALEVEPGNPFSGAVQFPGDEDVVKVALPSLRTLEVTLAANSAMPIDVLAADGSLEATLARGGAKHQLFSAQPTLFYLKGKGAQPNALGAFSAVVADLGVDDHGDTAAHATTLTPSSTLGSGQFNRVGDVDAFGFDTTVGELYSFACNPTGSSYGCSVVLRNAAGTVLAQDTGSGSSFVTWEATGAERLTVLVSDSYSGGASTYTYKLENLGPDDYPDTIATAAVVRVDTTVAGRIETTTDVDAFSFTATAGHLYRVVCTASPALYNCSTTITSPTGATVSGTRWLAVAGDYKVLVRGSGSYAGTYTLLVTDEGADDFGNTAAGAGALTLGAPTTGNIQYSGDSDFFSFTATANHLYRLTCTASSAYLCTLAVRDATSTLVTSSSYGTTVTLSFRAVTAGAYTVQASAYSSSASGSYTLTVADIGTDDHSDTNVGATAVTLGVATAGSIQFAYDKDVFSFTGTAAHIYRVQCTSSSSSVCALALSDASGTSLGSSGSNTNSSASFRATSGGAVYVLVSGSSASLGTYTLTVTDAGVDDHSDTTVGATPLISGTQAAGEIQFLYDKDVFSFTTTAGHIYRVSCTTAVSYLCELVVKNSSGTTVASSRSGSATPASFIAPTAGTWTVEVTNSYPSALGVYSMLLTDAGVDDHGDTPAAATVLAIGGAPVAGDLQHATDKDVYSFTATLGHIYRFTCTSSFSSLCRLTVRDSMGTTVASASASALSQATFVAPAASVYSVEVANYSSGSTGAYTVQVADLGVDDHGNAAATATALSARTIVNGSIEFGGDVDVCSFSAAVNHIYRVTCTSSSYGLCALTLRNPSAVSVASAYESALSVINHKATVPGTFTVEVRGYSTSTGTYQLKYEDLGADDHGDTRVTGTTITTGVATSGTLEASGDLDYFTVTLAAGTTYTVTVTAGFFTYLYLYNSAGYQVGSYSTSGTSRYTPTTSGTYYVRVSGYDGTSVGAYSVLVQ
jgi:hypothetical protein